MLKVLKANIFKHIVVYVLTLEKLRNGYKRTMYNVHRPHKPACLPLNKRPKIDGKIQLFRLMLAAILEYINKQTQAAWRVRAGSRVACEDVNF